MFQAYPPVLYLQGLLTEMDGEMLAAYCYAVGMIHRCQRRIKRDGLQLRRPIGQVYIHPLSRHRPPGSAVGSTAGRRVWHDRQVAADVAEKP